MSSIFTLRKKLLFRTSPRKHSVVSIRVALCTVKSYIFFLNFTYDWCVIVFLSG